MVLTSWSKKKRESISLEQNFSEVVACFKKEAGLKTAMELSRGSPSRQKRQMLMPAGCLECEFGAFGCLNASDII